MSELLTFADVEKRLGVRRRTVNRLISRKVLKRIVIGHRTIRFAPADVERAIERMKGESK